MKRLLLILAVILIALLSACGEPPTVSTEFDADFAVTQEDIAYKGTLTLSDGTLSVVFSEPYTVQGMAFNYGADGMRITYAGHETAANCDYIPSKAIPQVLHNALAYLPQATYTGSDESGDCFSLPTPYGEATLTAKDGVPTALDDPHAGLRFRFIATG